MDSRATSGAPSDESRLLDAAGGRWLAWVIGSALLLAVVVAASRLAEEREFVRIVEQAEPLWLVVAVLLQAGTYLAQAEALRAVPMSSRIVLPRGWLYQLSLAKLFVDQALPSAGLSSTLVIVKALEARGVPRPAAAACAMINIASYHAAYIVTLIAALVITSVLHEASVVLVSVSVLFIAFALGMTVGVIVLAGRRAKPGGLVTRLPGIRSAIEFLERSDAVLVRNRRLLTVATAWQIAIFLLDAATIWVCIRALGAMAAPDAVFASFMISSLVRTMGIVPGGLGTYEAASVLTLRFVGVSLSVALSATLVFRGLSFWVPMLPGLWASRRITRIAT
jgi:Mg2+-importing ATPase